MPSADESFVTCPGCGGKNGPGSTECDWCGRTFVSRGGRLRLTLWQVVSGLLLLGLIAAFTALAYLNAGRALPPVRASAAASSTPLATLAPTPVVTPRVLTRSAPTATQAPSASGPTAEPTPMAQPTQPVPTPTPTQQAARIANTNGLGAKVHLQPGAQTPQVVALREGTRVLLTGNDQTVAARPWREIETEDHNLKGWVQGDLLQLQQSQP